MSASQSRSADEYARVVETLTRHQVEFVICGGVACVLHGSPRHTRDMDLSVRLESANLRRFIAAVRELKLQPRIPEPLEALADDRKRAEWIEKKNAVVYTLVSLDSPLHIDMFLTYPIPYDELHRDADLMRFERVAVRVSSKAHLIKAKQQVDPPRPHDRFDIEFLQDLIDREQ